LPEAGPEGPPVLRGARRRARAHARGAEGRRGGSDRPRPPEAVLDVLPAWLLWAPGPACRVLRFVRRCRVRRGSRL